MPRINLLRVRHGHEHSRVTFVELFFDLVFVFAVTQLSHSLIAHFTPLGGLQTALLLMAVWLTWIYTSWATNWLDPESMVIRILLFAVMLGGLILSSSIPEAFEDRGLAFALALALIQLGRTSVLVFAFRRDARRAPNFQRIVAWMAFSSLFWVAGGLAEGNWRLALWIVALTLDYLGPVVAFWTPGLGRSATSDWDIEGGHMAERCALFIIIALGESILVTGATFSALDWTTPVVAAFASSFLASVAMWWIYFNASAEAGSRIISASNDPGRLGRSAYTYMHLPIVAGIILNAVGDELVLGHATGHTEPPTVIAVVGGPALYVAGIALFKWAVGRRMHWWFFAGILVALGGLVPLSAYVSPLGLSAAATLILILICVADVFVAEPEAAAAAVPPAAEREAAE